MLTGGTKEFHLHFLQLGKALKGSSGLQGGDVIVVEAAAENKLKWSLTITQNKFLVRPVETCVHCCLAFASSVSDTRLSLISLQFIGG